MAGPGYPPLFVINVHIEMPTTFEPSFLPTEGRQPPWKLEKYAHLYASYTCLIQQQGDKLRGNTVEMTAAYEQVAAEFATEQRNYARNVPGSSYVLADLNEYARRCRGEPQSFEE